MRRLAIRGFCGQVARVKPRGQQYDGRRQPLSRARDGETGYIDSHATLALLDSGWPVVVLDNLATGFRWAVPEAATFAQGDVSDMDFVSRVISRYQVGAIMHFAGSVVVPDPIPIP